MGDPRRLKNKYSKPKKMMDGDRIAEEKGLKRTYGLKNMRELWVASEELKRARREARRLLSLTESERKNQEGVILSKLRRLGILDDKARVEDILSLTVKDVLERRLQTRVIRRGLAKTMVQARQLITHGFIAINDRMVKVPSYLVTAGEEPTVRHYKKIEIDHRMPEPTKAEAKKPEAAGPAPEAAPAEAPKE